VKTITPGPGQDALFSADELPATGPRLRGDDLRNAIHRHLAHRQPMLTVTEIARALRLPMPLGVALVDEQLTAMEDDGKVIAHADHCDPRGLIVPRWEAREL